MYKYIKSFILALSLYIIIIVSFLYAFKQEKNIFLQNRKEQVIQFSIIQEPNPVHKKKETLVQKKELKKIKKITKKKTTPKTVEKKKQVIVKKEINTDKILKNTLVNQKQAIIKQNKSIQKNTINYQDILKKRKLNQNRYYTQIKETINKNKTYPRVAVKRGIEGIVKIKFTISKNGELLSFKIIEGKKVFKKSIENAVKNSFPITPPKNLLTSNRSLSLRIDYKLY